MVGVTFYVGLRMNRETAVLIRCALIFEYPVSEDIKQDNGFLHADLNLLRRSL